MDESLGKKLVYFAIAHAAILQPDPVAFLQKIEPFIKDITDADVVERKNDIDKVSD